MNIAVMGENSQIILSAFMELGHTGMSCDLNYDGEKGLPHYRGDMFDILGCGWDLVIAHPPCTAIAISGNRYYAKHKPAWMQSHLWSVSGFLMVIVAHFVSKTR